MMKALRIHTFIPARGSLPKKIENNKMSGSTLTKDNCYPELKDKNDILKDKVNNH